MIQKDPLTQAIAEAAKKVLMGEDSAGAFPAQMGMTPVYVNKEKETSSDDENIEKELTSEESGEEYTGADQIVPAEHPGPKVASAEDSQGNDVKEAALSDEEIADKVQAIFNRFGILDQDYEEDIEAAIERLSKKSALAAAQVKSLLKDSVNEANILGAQGIDDTRVSPGDNRWQALHDLKQSGYSGEKQDAAAEISGEPTRPLGKGTATVNIDGQEDADELAKNAGKGMKKALEPATHQGVNDKGETLPDTTGAKPGIAVAPSKQNNPEGESLPDTTGQKNPKAQPPKRGATASDPMPKMKVESVKHKKEITEASNAVAEGKFSSTFAQNTYNEVIQSGVEEMEELFGALGYYFSENEEDLQNIDAAKASSLCYKLRDIFRNATGA